MIDSFLRAPILQTWFNGYITRPESTELVGAKSGSFLIRLSTNLSPNQLAATYNHQNDVKNATIFNVPEGYSLKAEGGKVYPTLADFISSMASVFTTPVRAEKLTSAIDTFARDLMKALEQAAASNRSSSHQSSQSNYRTYDDDDEDENEKDARVESLHSGGASNGRPVSRYNEHNDDDDEEEASSNAGTTKAQNHGSATNRYASHDDDEDEDEAETAKPLQTKSTQGPVNHYAQHDDNEEEDDEEEDYHRGSGMYRASHY